MPVSKALAIRNSVLARLPPDALDAVLLELSPVEVSKGTILHTPGTTIEAVLFPVSGMISLVANLEDGSQAEVGIIGREGILGISLLSGTDKPFVEAMVQMPGIALGLTAKSFRQSVDTNHGMRMLVLRYSEFLQAQVMQTAACNGRHGLDERLARWLLMAHDRADDDEVPLTQEFMAMMLGVLRPSVSIAAAKLQRAKLIRYAAGHITVLNRSALEDASCACYEAVQQRFAALLGKNDVAMHRAVQRPTVGNSADHSH